MAGNPAVQDSCTDLAVHSPHIGPYAFSYRRVLGIWQHMHLRSMWQVASTERFVPGNSFWEDFWKFLCMVSIYTSYRVHLLTLVHV